MKRQTASSRIQQLSQKTAIRGNPLPNRDSNWFELAQDLDIGVLDLDAVADDMGYRDFRNLDISISPKALARDHRQRKRLFDALRANSLKAEKWSDGKLLKVIENLWPKGL